MADESFNDVMGHAPVYSSGLPGVSVTNPAEFKEWHGRVRRAHEREVDGGVAAMTNAQLAEHGLCRIGSAAMWDEVRDTKDRELSEEHGLVRLPVDADGEYIHIGDVMDTEHFGTVEVEGFVHSAVAFYNYSGQPAYICTAPANTCHHHEPTVETTLQEMLEQAVGYSDAHTTVALNAIAEYSAKLRLANDWKEQ